MHTYHGSSKTSSGRQGSPDSTSKPIKNHSFQNQRWHRSRSERSHTRNHPRQPLSDTSARPSFVGTTPLGDWRVRRDPSDLCSSESEKEVGSAESRGAKPKRLTHVSGGSLRGPRDKTKHSYEREKRVAPKQKADEMFENIPPRDVVKSGNPNEEGFKSRHDHYEGSRGNVEKQRTAGPGNRPSREALDWKKNQAEVQPTKRDAVRQDKSHPSGFSKEKKADRGKEPSHSTYQEPKSHGHHWPADGEKHAGRKHPSQERASKQPVQSGLNRQWKKHDVPKSKETHTGETPYNSEPLCRF